MIYEIDFVKAVIRLLPPFLRKEKQIAWLSSLIKPIQEKRDELFDLFYPLTIKKLNQNGQTIVLEKILNDFYEQDFGTIYIVNVRKDSASSYVGPDNNTNVYVGIDSFTDAYIGTSYAITNVNFMIYVPSFLIFNQDEMRSIVDAISLYGTTYSIITY